MRIYTVLTFVANEDIKWSAKKYSILLPSILQAEKEPVKVQKLARTPQRETCMGLPNTDGAQAEAYKFGEPRTKRILRALARA